MIDILSYLPAKRKSTASGWTSFNSPCCEHNGQSKDTRGRGGIKLTDDGWVYHCFNCNFKATFKIGRPLSVKLRKLLSWLKVDSHDIEVLNLESLKHRTLADLIPTPSAPPLMSYADRPLGTTVELISNNTQDQVLVDYLHSRGLTLDDYPFMKDSAQSRPGVLIPYTYKNRIVGHTIRFLDSRKPKYLSDQPPHFVFGVDLQNSSWSAVIVVEGVFDAISINGVGLLHNDISNEQARVLQSLGKEIIVVPDQDLAGLAVVDKAIEYGFSVSVPNWEGCKDVNDAVCKYGKLFTLLSILQAKETSRIKIELRKKQLLKHLGNNID